MSKWYRVCYNASIGDELHIDAESEEEALNIAEKQLNRENYDYYVIEDVELGGEDE